jgi:hypothetical protein
MLTPLLQYPPLPLNWVFPSTEEFAEDHPLRDLLPIEDHTTLLRIARPTLRFFISFAAKGLAMDSGGSELAVTLLDEAIDPEYPIFVSPFYSIAIASQPILICSGNNQRRVPRRATLSRVHPLLL